MSLRIGVASVMQETNTFSPVVSTMKEFEAQGILAGDDVLTLVGTNTEAGGALARLRERGVEAVPVFRAWAMSGGPITDDALAELLERFRHSLEAAGELDGLVLALHGAFVSESAYCADARVLETAKAVLGARPIGVSLDLHANLTAELVASPTFLIGYRTYPHVDMADTGARVAELLEARVTGKRRPVTRFAKRPLLIPAEAQGLDGPLGELRKAADDVTGGRVLDVSLFPVQPWLDVPELGYAVSVTTDDDPARGDELAEELADAAWRLRGSFEVELLTPPAAIAEARASTSRPVLMTESADSPSAGATADSPAMIAALVEHAGDLRSYVTLVDVGAVEACFGAGVGATLSLGLGSSLEQRFHQPVEVEGTVRALGSGPYRLTGPVFTGMEYAMGRYARVDVGRLSILVTELPACTFDPEAYRQVGLDPGEADIVVVRSAHMFRAGWAEIAVRSIVLDLPGASTPKLASLEFRHAPRPLFPIDPI